MMPSSPVGRSLANVLGPGPGFKRSAQMPPPPPPHPPSPAKILKIESFAMFMTGIGNITRNKIIYAIESIFMD